MRVYLSYLSYSESCQRYSALTMPRLRTGPLSMSMSIISLVL